MKKSAKRIVSADPAVAQLESIKRLLILQLLASDVKSSAIAKALDVDPAVISRLVPARNLKKS